MTDIDKNAASGAPAESKDSVQQPEASGDGNQQQSDKVAYETYKRTLSEAKKYKSELQDLKQKVSSYEEKLAMDEGKKDEVIEKLRREKEQVYNTLKQKEADFAEKQIRAQVESKAREAGCVDVEALCKLVDFDGLDVDGYEVSQQSLEMVLGEAKNKRPYLFSKPAPKLHDGVPANEKPNGKVDFSKMSTEEMKQWARKNLM